MMKRKRRQNLSSNYQTNDLKSVKLYGLEHFKYHFNRF